MSVVDEYVLKLNSANLKHWSIVLLHSEHELLRGEVAAVKAAKDKLNARVVELEEEARKYKEAIDIHKQRSPSEDEVRSLLSIAHWSVLT